MPLSCRQLTLGTILAASFLGFASADQSGGLPISSLRRIVRSFDFEEVSQGGANFPDHFVRYRSEDQGFPLFGQMGLTDQRSADGQWSFQFDLEGGSMAARTLPGTAPVLPLAGYMVSAKVQTQGLKNARARLVAWMVDAAGQVIPQSRVESRLVGQTRGWEFISAELNTEFPQAADLVLELQVLQPRQFRADGSAADIALLDDIAGQVWFDSVEVAHLPQIRLNTSQPSSVYIQPARPIFEIVIRDHINDNLTAAVRVMDMYGNTCYREQFAAPNGHSTFMLETPIDTCGWYRAILEVQGSSATIGRREVCFVIVPRAPAAPALQSPACGIALSGTDVSHAQATDDLLRILNPACIILNAWNQQLTRDRVADHYQNVRLLLDRAAQLNCRTLLSLSQLPSPLAELLGVEPWQVLEMFQKDPALWRTWLSELLVQFGQEIRDWQLGAGDTPESFWHPDSPQRLSAAREALSGFVSDPSIFVEQPIELLPHPDAGGRIVRIPIEWPDDGVYQFLAADPPRELDIVKLDLLASGQASPEARVLHAATRTLWAWRAGASTLMVDSPWEWSAEQVGLVVPDPTFPAWLELHRQLAGSTFGGEIQLGERIHCWIIRAPRNAQSGLVLWSDDAGPLPQPVQLQLGQTAADVSDIFGNRRAVYPANHAHTLAVGRMPIFIRNIDVHLAEFRGMFSIEPSFVPAQSSLHEHEVVVHNPWDSPITASIRLRDSTDWHIVPKVISISVPARKSARAPITIVLDRNVISGIKQVHADVHVSAETEVDLQLAVPLEIGLSSVQMSVTPLFSRNLRTGGIDVVLALTLTNIGNEVLTMDAVAHAPGLAQNRSKLPPLLPGETLHRRLILPGSGPLLSGQTVRLGLVSREGFSRLNQLVHVPEVSGSAALAGVPDRR